MLSAALVVVVAFVLGVASEEVGFALALDEFAPLPDVPHAARTIAATTLGRALRQRKLPTGEHLLKQLIRPTLLIDQRDRRLSRCNRRIAGGEIRQSPGRVLHQAFGSL